MLCLVIPGTILSAPQNLSYVKNSPFFGKIRGLEAVETRLPGVTLERFIALIFITDSSWFTALYAAI